MKHRCTQRSQDWLGQEIDIICEEDENTGELYLSINDLDKMQSIVIQPTFCPLCGKSGKIVVDIP